MKKMTTICLTVLILSLVIPFLGSNSVAGAESTEPIITPPPSNLIDWSAQNPFQKSGIYTYQVINESAHLATIRSIDTEADSLTLPSELNGYKIVGLGQDAYASTYLSSGSGLISQVSFDTPFGIMGANAEKLKTITLPKELLFIGESAFSGCTNLSSIEFSDSLAGIGIRAFKGCRSLSDLHISSGTVVGEDAFEDCGTLNQVIIESASLGKAVFSGTKIKKVIFPNGKEKHLSLRDCLTDDIEIIQIGSKIKSLDLSNNYNEQSPCFGKIGKIIVTGKNTKLKYWNKKNKLGVVCTTPKAACISWAKKYKLNYQTKSSGKIGEITKKKNTFSWKKVSTKLTKYTYKKTQKKWKKTVKSAKTLYKIYGKNKKAGVYQFMKNTTKSSIKSSYKYVKVTVAANWV